MIFKNNQTKIPKPNIEIYNNYYQKYLQINNYQFKKIYNKFSN